MARSRRGRGRARRSRGGGTPKLDTIARERFGIQRIRPQQRVAMKAVLERRDTFAVLPTGFGKSLIYQVTAMMVDRPTIVVSPLLALISDQLAKLRACGIPAIRLDSTLLVRERRETLARLEEGGSLVVLTTPETIESEAVGPCIAAAKPWMLVIDEAHCISEWGHDFRPAYLRLGVERARLGDPVVLALTATATSRVRDDIAQRLALRDPVILHEPPYRANLRFSVVTEQGDAKIFALAKRLRRLQRPGIIYCSTTKAVDGIWNSLQGPRVRHRIPALAYHGKMKTADRKAAQLRFMRKGKKLIMVATSAFGMGIDKPDIRYVVHYQAPGSLEQYVQEAGRAGRDGRPAVCELLFDPADLEIQRFLADAGRSSGAQLRRVAKALLQWHAEGRPVGVRDLAVSAATPQTAARTLAAQLEGLGVVRRERNKAYRVIATKTAVDAAVRTLVAALDVKNRADDKRLAAVEAYARTQMCRAAFLRRYFGEDDPPDCGVCDRCRASKGSRSAGHKLASTPPRSPAPGGDEPKKRRRRRRRKKRPATSTG